MRHQLNEKDIKNLKYQCRMGYLLPGMVFILLAGIGVFVYEYNFNTEKPGLNTEADVLIMLLAFTVAFLLSFAMNRKYYADIRFKEKRTEEKIIQRKIDRVDFEAGSGNMTTMPHNNPMNKFTRYELVVDNERYRVSKQLYEQCSKGGKLLFNFAPRSNYLLDITMIEEE